MKSSQQATIAGQKNQHVFRKPEEELKQKVPAKTYTAQLLQKIRIGLSSFRADELTRQNLAQEPEFVTFLLLEAGLTAG